MHIRVNRARADALLLFAALIWGTTFVAQKFGNQALGPLSFVAARFVIASICLLPLALWEARRARHGLQPGELRNGVVTGVCLCAGCLLQQVGLQHSSASHAGFLTAVYIVLVPPVAWVFTGQAPRPVVVLATALAIAGSWLLSTPAATLPYLGTSGDLLILSTDIIWALHINLISRLSSTGARPMLLSWLQSTVTAALALPLALAAESSRGSQLLTAAPALAYAGIASSVIAFSCQIVGQRHTPAAEAALIMSLESVFAALAGVLLLGEYLGARAIAGAGLIMIAVAITEAGPRLAAAWSRAWAQWRWRRRARYFPGARAPGQPDARADPGR